MKERSRARGWALQVLYAWESRGEDRTPYETLVEFQQERRIALSSRTYLRELVRLIGDHLAEIDSRVQGALTNWRLERLSAIDRNILRIGAAEMLYVPDVPARVSIQEALRLAEKYGTSESPRFVNGVLDALMRGLEGRGSGREGGP